MDVGLEKRIGASLHMDRKKNTRAPVEHVPGPLEELL